MYLYIILANANRFGKISRTNFYGVVVFSFFVLSFFGILNILNVKVRTFGTDQR